MDKINTGEPLTFDLTVMKLFLKIYLSTWLRLKDCISEADGDVTVVLDIT